VPLPLLAALILLPWIGPDPLRAQALDSLPLHWTAPDDQPSTGAVARYDIRLATSPLDDSNFDLALQLPTLRAGAAGSRETYVVRGLSPGRTFWVALRAIDRAGNRSALSNVVQWTTPGSPQLDHVAPAVPLGLQAARGDDGRSVSLAWTPGTAPDLAGYSVYRATGASGPWYLLTLHPQLAPAMVDRSLPYGIEQLYYAVTASDFSGNESAQSPAIAVDLRHARAASTSAWRLLPAYPNPAHAGVATALPVEVPTIGGQARIEIFDGVGQLVRTFELVAGAQTFQRLDWDGRNDHGQPCAPGLYRVRLTTDHGAIETLRVARLP
jgi:hypothetical protein